MIVRGKKLYIKTYDNGCLISTHSTAAAQRVVFTIQNKLITNENSSVAAERGYTGEVDGQFNYLQAERRGGEMSKVKSIIQLQHENAINFLQSISLCVPRRTGRDKLRGALEENLYLL